MELRSDNWRILSFPKRFLYAVRQRIWYNLVMIGTEPPYHRDPIRPHEPLRHVATFIAVAAVLFLLCVVIFHALEHIF